jgi:diaminohydroxyphosphoribosylaminopyrimidine deaminase/5-amino-6-(5-phosphoribosylamino)uracil reductase
MRHAITLAARGPSYGVNPQVGCVILSESGETMAEGWHRGAGTTHAEVDALSKLGSGEANGATAVVTLEPCNHTGHTGPCSEALISAGITTVAYAIADPNPRAGGGAKHLHEAGVSVVAGVLADEAQEAILPWLTATRLGRPYVTVKWASSLDGRTAAADGTSQWITGATSRLRVHEQRSRADAIIVGTGTVLADDPALTARNDAGELLPHQPVPVVIGERAIPTDAKLFQHPLPAIVTESRDLRGVLDRLFARDIRHVLVEGGPTLASAFVAEGLADEYLIYLAPMLLGGDHLALSDIGVGTLADARKLQMTAVERVGDDLLVVARPRENAHDVSAIDTKEQL